MGNKTSRGMTYEQYYEFLKNQNGGTLYGVHMDLGGMDPYEVLGIRKKFTWDELKNAYRTKAKLVHPDKGGTQELFNLVTDCFKTLAEEYTRNLDAKSHHELKSGSRDYYANNMKPVATRVARGEQDEEDFHKRFNRMFDENKLDDEEADTGYGHMMAKSTGKREDIDVPRTMKKFNKDNFNQEFERTVPVGSAAKEVVVYKEPQPLTLAKTMAYTELGGKTDDYSSSVERGEKRGLVYSDYMRAHTTSRLIDATAVMKSRKEYRNLDEYEAARAQAVANGPTEDERRWMEERETMDSRREQERIERLKMRDAAISSHFQRVNGLLR